MLFARWIVRPRHRLFVCGADKLVMKMREARPSLAVLSPLVYSATTYYYHPRHAVGHWVEGLTHSNPCQIPDSSYGFSRMLKPEHLDHPTQLYQPRPYSLRWRTNDVVSYCRHRWEMRRFQARCNSNTLIDDFPPLILTQGCDLV